MKRKPFPLQPWWWVLFVLIVTNCLFLALTLNALIADVWRWPEYWKWFGDGLLFLLTVCALWKWQIDYQAEEVRQNTSTLSETKEEPTILFVFASSKRKQAYRCQQHGVSTKQTGQRQKKNYPKIPPDG